MAFPSTAVLRQTEYTGEAIFTWKAQSFPDKAKKMKTEDVIGPEDFPLKLPIGVK